jgi:beta-glucanase (GH16 family)
MADPMPEGYELVWSDEFENVGIPNPANWKFEEGFVRNRELQWYQKENAWCEDGLLYIEARREEKSNPNYLPDHNDWKRSRARAEYTSSSIKTQGLQSFQYGIIEVRARIKTQDGLWPAIWTLGTEGRWPENGECDIMEYYEKHILANFAWGSEQRQTPIWDGAKIKLSQFEDPDFENKFHIWKLVWTQAKMQIYLDEELLNELDLSLSVNASNQKNPFHQPHYILLNLAIGSNGGDPLETSFPNQYAIDYVRVYQETE